MMKILGINWLIAISSWYVSYGFVDRTDNCDRYRFFDLLPLANCSVLIDKLHFLHVSCDMNCFARSPKLGFGQDIYTVLTTVGYESTRPLTSVDESVCLEMTNVTIVKFIESYKATHGTNFELAKGTLVEISAILEAKAVIVFPKGFRITTVVARIESACDVSSSDFQVSATDDERNTSCKVSIFGIAELIHTARGIPGQRLSPSVAKATMRNISRTFNLDKATVLLLRIRFKPGLNQLKKFCLSHINKYKILKFEFLKAEFDTIENGDFEMFSSLEVLNLTGGKIRTIEPRAFKSLTNLSILDLSYNKLPKIPDTLYSGPLPKITYLTMESNSPDTERFTIFSSELKTTSLLSVLRLSKTPIRKLESNNFTQFPRLKELHLDRCDIAYVSSNAFWGLSLLSTLNLAENRIQSLPDDVFQPLLSLKHLNVGRNEIKNLSEKQFDNLCYLTSLNLENNQISELLLTFPPGLRELNLRSNHIKHWIPMNIAQLYSLDLSMNRITSLTKEMQMSFDGIHDVNVSMNPFDCSPCPLSHLQKWLRNSTAQDSLLYICSYPSSVAGKAAMGIPSSPEACLLRTASSTGMIVLIILLAITAALGYVGYYRRWNIRYLWLKLRLRIQNYKKRRAFSIDKTYDAFVSYAPSEKIWLKRELVPQLESGENRLRLCVHDRDIEAGHEIPEAIIEYINKSRNVILVLSEAFNAEDWCLFEMNVAYQNLLEDKINGLVLVKLGDIKPQSLNKLLDYLIKTRTYLEWPSSEEAKPLFWERLRCALSRDDENLFKHLI